MANCHDEFQDYRSELDLLEGQETKLRNSRDVLRNRIASYFSNKSLRQPRFRSQGSFPLETQNRPLNDEFDLDDGIYCLHYRDDENPSVGEVFQLVEDAVKGHTSENGPRKDTCVRVVYKQPTDDAPAHHIDEAIYREKSDGTKFYAHRTKGWSRSDQPGFIDLFKKHVEQRGPQFRSDVRHLKGWADKQQGGIKLPSGFHHTVLVMECFSGTAGRDDTSLVKTAEAIRERFYSAYFLGTGKRFYRPVAPGEDIFADYDVQRLQHLLNKLDELIREGNRALVESDHRKGCQIWQALLGDRFPVPEESAKTWNAPAILGASGRSG